MARDDEWDYGDGAGGDDEWEYEEAPGVLRTFGRHLRQGFNPLWDEGAGVMGAGVDSFEHLRQTGNVVTPHEWLEGYRRNRDESRDTDLRGSQANPVAATSGKVTGALGGGLVAGGAGGLGGGALRAITSGATQGAAQGLASSEADLTYQDAEAYARAFRDTLTGGAAGAAFGGLGYGAGKGLKWVGEKARGLWAGGRAQLADEARAGLSAEEDALRAADARAAAPLERAHGQGLEMNRRVDARAAREEARRVAAEAREAVRRARAGRPTRGVDPSAEPDTRVLEGFRGKAGERRAVNYDRVAEYRRAMQDPALSPAGRDRLRQYAEKYADAVDNPAAFERRMVERYLRERYSPEVAERILRERVGPGGEILPRRPAAQPTPEQPLLPERTQVAEPADWLKRGHDPMEVLRQGGGGSAFGEDFANAPTRVDPSMQPDPFHDAPTRLALIRTSPVEGVNGQAASRWGDVHLFEMRASNGKIFEAKVSASPHFPDEIQIESIHPKGATGGDYIAMGREHANTIGARDIKRLAEDLSRFFPNAKRLTSVRMSGANPGRDMEMRMPEVTQRGAPEFETQVVRPPDAPPPAPQQRQFRSDEGHGPYRDWPENEPTANDAMPRGEWEGVDVDLPPPAVIEDPTQVGWPSFPPDVQRAAPLSARPTLRPGQPYAPVGAPRRSALPPEDVRAAEEAMAARRAAAAGSGPSAPALEATSGARPRAMAPEASASMRAPQDAPGPLPDDVTRTAPRWEGGRLPPRPPMPDAPEATQAGQPSAFTERTRYAPPSMEQRLGGRDSVEDIIAQRERRALLDLGLAGYEGARRAHNFVAAPIGALVGITKESLRNPAVRVRAISALRLARLAAIRPEVWGRVSATLSRAAQLDAEKGTDHHLKAARHVLLQRDSDFRAADAQAAEEVQRMDDDALARRLSAQ